MVLGAVSDLEFRQKALLPNRLGLNQVPTNDTSALTKSSIAAADVIDALYFVHQVNTTQGEARITQLLTQILGITLQVRGIKAHSVNSLPLQQFDLFPTTDDPIFWKLELISNSTDPDPTVVNQPEFYRVLSQVIRANLDSVTWFAAAAVGIDTLREH